VSLSLFERLSDLARSRSAQASAPAPPPPRRSKTDQTADSLTADQRAAMLQLSPYGVYREIRASEKIVAELRYAGLVETGKCWFVVRATVLGRRVVSHLQGRDK